MTLSLLGQIFFFGGEMGHCSASTYLPICKSFPRCEIWVESNAFPPSTEARGLDPASLSMLAPRILAS